MDLILRIPDDLAQSLGAPADLSRRALELLVVEEFKNGRIATPQLRRLLGFGSRYELDGFLKANGVYEEYTLEDLERDRQDLKAAGF